MKFGICASFQEIVALPAIPPIDYIEESVQRFLMPERLQEEFTANLAEARRVSAVPIETANLFLPGDLYLIATPERPIDHIRLERYVKTALQRAEQAGIQVIVFGSGRVRAYPEGYDAAKALQQLAEHLATWGPWAHEHGVQIVLEPLRYEETNILNTVAEAGTLVTHVATPGIALLADTYHMGSNGEDPASIIPVAAKLAHVHVAELEGRSAPGTHNEDFGPYFSALRQTGYDQRISIECRWQNLSTEIVSAVTFLREQWLASAR